MKPTGNLSTSHRPTVVSTLLKEWAVVRDHKVIQIYAPTRWLDAPFVRKGADEQDRQPSRTNQLKLAFMGEQDTQTAVQREGISLQAGDKALSYWEAGCFKNFFNLLPSNSTAINHLPFRVVGLIPAFVSVIFLKIQLF